MRRGDFESAWRATDQIEHARRLRGGRRPELGELMWDGTPFDGRRVLVRCLHGLGDTIQHLRFVPEICAVAARVYLAVQPALLPLLSAQANLGEVIDGWVTSWPEHDVEIEVMELAYALRKHVGVLPGPLPYLDPQSVARRATWRPPKGTGSQPRIGLVWKTSAWDPSRSMTPADLAPLRSCSASFYSLQQEATESEMASLPFPVHSFAPHTTDPLDAAAAMLWCDAIIAVDGMPAHLAGALGRQTWLALKERADWRWMDSRNDSPWYPSLRLFRRSSTWSDVMERIAREVTAAMSFSREPQASPRLRLIASGAT